MLEICKRLLFIIHHMYEQILEDIRPKTLTKKLNFIPILIIRYLIHFSSNKFNAQRSKQFIIIFINFRVCGLLLINLYIKKVSCGKKIKINMPLVSILALWLNLILSQALEFYNPDEPYRFSQIRSKPINRTSSKQFTDV